MHRLSRDLEFLYEIGTLRNIERSWTQYMWKNVANVWEHIFRVIWIALIIAKNEGVTNTEKVVRMALFHDISETRSGDTHYLSRNYVKRFEDEAVSDMLNSVSIQDDVLGLWQEYEQRDSIEAKIVKDADNLDVDLELMEEIQRGNRLAEEFQRRRPEMRHKLHTETAKALFDLIIESNPNSWHLNAKNRFNSRDWDDKK